MSLYEPFGSRPDPGACRIASVLLLPPGEVPEGRAGDLSTPCAPLFRRGRYSEKPAHQLPTEESPLLKTEWFAPNQLIAPDRRAPIAFDVLHNQVGALVVSPLPTMEGVRQIPAEYRLLAQIDELANAVRSPEHAEIRVDPHDDDVVNASVLEKVEEFLALAGNGIRSVNLDQFSLPPPRVGWPGFAARIRKVAGAWPWVRHAGWKRSLMVRVAVVPAKLYWGVCVRRLLRRHSSRMAGIEFHAASGSVDDGGPAHLQPG